MHITWVKGEKMGINISTAFGEILCKERTTEWILFTAVRHLIKQIMWERMSINAPIYVGNFSVSCLWFISLPCFMGSHATLVAINFSAAY